MKLKSIFFFLFGLVQVTSLSQSAKLLKANKYFENLSYSYSIELYEELVNTKEANYALKSKLAYSYLKTDNYNKAAELYKEIIDSIGKTTDPLDFYNYSYVLKILGNYELSDYWMHEFGKVFPTDSRVQLFLSKQDYKTRIEKNNPYFSLKPVDFNTNSSDFGGYYRPYTKEIYFISSRDRRSVDKSEWTWNGDRLLDIYRVEKQQKNDTVIEYQNLKQVSKLNTFFHEGSMAFSSDGKMVYFTRNNISTWKSRRDTNKIQNLKLYYAKINDKGRFYEELEFPYNSNNHSIGHPALSPDGKTLYFVSDMLGGFGGTDLYKVEIEEDGSFGEPINLGEEINTTGNEMFPFMDSNGLLFFSSDGYPGLGGLDVYVAHLGENRIESIQNLGTPINSSYDDFAFTLNPNGKEGFVSSNRKGNTLDDNIYRISPLRAIDKDIPAVIEGQTVSKLGIPIPYASVILKDGNEQIIDTIQSDRKGFYSFEVKKYNNYNLTAQKEHYTEGNFNVLMNFDTLRNGNIILDLDLKFSLYGIVLDNSTNLPLSGVVLEIIDNTSPKTFDLETDERGDFNVPLADKNLNDKGDFTIHLRKEGYFPKTVKYKEIFDKEGQYNISLSTELLLDRMVSDVKEMIDIQPIHFNLGSHAIRPDAAKELDKIVKVMNEYPQMTIELGAHTDCRGSKQSNRILSSRRAESSANYIKKRITNPDRIYGIGYGDSQPLINCECIGNKSNCSEEEHAKNRRTEFKIIASEGEK